jgi:HlyD family secretion protein
MLTWIKRIVVVVVLLSLLGFGGAWMFGSKTDTAVAYRTSKVGRSDVVAAINATGTVEPDEVIDVGSQVTGQIVAFGTDANGKQIDYVSPITAGSVVAQIDPTTYKATLAEAKAQLSQAQAGVLRAQADQQTAKAKFTQAERDWQRAEKIGPGDALAQTTYDTYKSQYEQAQAAIAVADATLATAKATIDQAQSTVDRAQRNLDFCTIKSPVDGVVVDRRVNIGQTVVSTQSASSLFLIARDFKHMQVWVAVNEADIGHIFPGQKVTFTCDAFGDRTFNGTVRKFRYNAQMTQNVVVYTVEVAVDNADLTLLPYLTANVMFETERADGTLNVPSGALRWTPTSMDQVVPDQRSKFSDKADEKPADAKPAEGPSGPNGAGGGPRGEGGHGMGGGKKKDKSKPAAPKPGQVWVKEGEFVRQVDVMTGVTDGAVTAITSDGLKEGDEVVTGVIAAAANPQQNGPTNPFLPQMRRGGGGGRR